MQIVQGRAACSINHWSITRHCIICFISSTALQCDCGSTPALHTLTFQPHKSIWQFDHWHTYSRIHAVLSNPCTPQWFLYISNMTRIPTNYFVCLYFLIEVSRNISRSGFEWCLWKNALHLHVAIQQIDRPEWTLCRAMQKRKRLSPIYSFRHRQILKTVH